MNNIFEPLREKGEPLRVFVFGNINSGKSTLSHCLQQVLPDYQYLAIDEYRKRFGNGTVQGEESAISNFIDDCLQFSNSIIEFSGCGSAADRLEKVLPRCSAIMLVCQRDTEDCINSISNEKFVEAPYPQEFQKLESLADTIRRLAPATTETALLDRWQWYIWQSYTIPFLATEKEIIQAVCFEHHKYAEQLKDFALNNEHIEELVAYGSMGANRLHQYSDLDFYVRSDIDPKNMKLLLESHFEQQVLHSDSLGNKITLRMKSALLIEVVCGRELEETALYYRESQIGRPEMTVFKGSRKTVETLYKFIEENKSIREMASPIVAEIYFLFCSLPKLLESGDSYKYYFHIAIMQHYAVQLESLLAENLKYNYLPKHAVNALPDFPWGCFSVSPVNIEWKQYHELYDYLRELFCRLEKECLTSKGKYFTPESAPLHCLISDKYLG